MRILPLVIGALLLAGCGYKQNNQYDEAPKTPPGPRSDVRTIAVPAFENKTKTAGVESPITQSVRDAIALSTPYKLREQSDADTAIEGRITGVELRGAATQPSDGGYRRIQAEFRWRDLWTEKELMGWKSVEASSPAGIADAIIATIGVPPATVPGREGYTWHTLYRQDVRTVAVPIFTNKSFSRGVEFQLTKAITNYLESSSPYKVVSREKADTILEGEIMSVDGSVISSDIRTALPQEEMITIRVNFVWKDQRSGKILVQRKAFDQSTMYYPTLGESAFVGKQNGVERLAIGIVEQLQADW
jgi:hypothetical protein